MSWSPFSRRGGAVPTRGENRARPPALLRKPTTNVRLSPSSYIVLDNPCAHRQRHHPDLFDMAVDAAEDTISTRPTDLDQAATRGAREEGPGRPRLGSRDQTRWRSHARSA